MFLIICIYFALQCRNLGLTMYSVVTLLDSDEVIVAASNWLNLDKKQCYWPPFKSPEKCMEAVQNRIKPETGGKPWEKLNIKFHREYVTFEKAKEGQQEIKERSFLLSTGFSGILKRPRLESTQEMLKLQHPPASTASTSRLSTDDKSELLQMLRDIKITVRENSAMLKKLLKENTVPEVPSSTSIPSKDNETNLNLPLRMLEDVARTERELSDATTRQKYVNYLSRIRGFGQKDLIKNIMQEVLSDDLAMQFNWQGRGDKKPFAKLILTDLIRDAASKQSINREDCDTEMKNYLWSITDRIGRRRPRDYGGVTFPTMLDSAFQSEIGMSFTDE